jgi:hypothetical protein
LASEYLILVLFKLGIERQEMAWDMLTGKVTKNMKTKMSWMLMIVFMAGALHPHLAFGGTLFVSPSGLNLNPGTLSLPLQTIQKAADLAQPGDVIRVLSGVYDERVKTKNSGRLGAPIVFQAVGAVTNCGFFINQSFVTIDGFNIVDNTRTVSFEGAIEIARELDTITLINNKIHDFDALRASIYGIHFNYSSNAAKATRNCIITNNLLKNISYVMMSLTCSNALVANNVLDFANTHDAIHCFGGEITICDNLFTNISNNPLVPDHTDIIQTFGDEPVEAYNVVFERNLIINCVAQLCQLEQKGRNIRNWTFRNNVWVNVGNAGNCDLENVSWYNNTFYRCTTNTAGPILLNCNIKGCAANAKVFNNIFFECGSLPQSVQFGWYFAENLNFMFSSDYNFVCGTGGARKNSSFSELHGINGGDPGFVDAAHYNFRLRKDSILIGKGIVLDGFSDDIRKKARPASGPWDVGAYQLVPPDAPTGLRIVP